MKKYKLLIIAAILSIGTMTATASSSASMAMNATETTNVNSSATEEATVRKLIMDFYSEVISFVNSGKDYEKVMNRYFTPEFMEIYTTVDEDVPEGELGFLDFDLISNSQDPEVAKAVIKDLKINSDSADGPTASAKISLMSKQYAPTPIEITLTKTSEGWKISDYNNLLPDMKAFKQEMKH